MFFANNFGEVDTYIPSNSLSRLPTDYYDDLVFLDQARCLSNYFVHYNPDVVLRAHLHRLHHEQQRAL